VACWCFGIRPRFEESSLSQLAAEGVPIIDLLPDSPKGISVVTADREDAGFPGDPPFD